MKRLAAVLALALLLGFGGARLLSGEGSAETAVATGCDPAEAIPSSGTLSLAYIGPSAPPHLDHDDYVLGGRVRWDSQAALDCIGADSDAAYEHEVSFDGDFAGRIWRLEHTFPDAAEVYADELVNDHDGRTVLALGVFRPEHLRAGVDYWFTLDTPLRAQVTASEHRFSLDGEIGSRICSDPNAWCVERSNTELRRSLIDGERGFDVALGGCWSWEYDIVSPCSGVPFPTIDEPGDRSDFDGGAVSALPELGSGTGDDDRRSRADDPIDTPTAGPSAGTEISGGEPSEASGSPSTGSDSTSAPDATTTTVARQAPPGATTTSTPTSPDDGPQIDPGSTPTTPPATPTTGPGVTTTTTTTTIGPTPTSGAPATSTTRPPAVTTTTRPPGTTPPTTRPPTTPPPTTTSPPTTAPPTTAPPTTNPPASPSFASISATSSRAGRIRVVARIDWPAGVTAPTCVTTLDGAVVSIKECGARLTVNMRGVSTGSHSVRVRACDRSVACTDSPNVVVAVG